MFSHNKDRDSDSEYSDVKETKVRNRQGRDPNSECFDVKDAQGNYIIPTSLLYDVKILNFLTSPAYRKTLKGDIVVGKCKWEDLLTNNTRKKYLLAQSAKSWSDRKKTAIEENQGNPPDNMQLPLTISPLKQSQQSQQSQETLLINTKPNRDYYNVNNKYYYIIETSSQELTAPTALLENKLLTLYLMNNTKYSIERITASELEKRLPSKKKSLIRGRSNRWLKNNLAAIKTYLEGLNIPTTEVAMLDSLPLGEIPNFNNLQSNTTTTTKARTSITTTTTTAHNIEAPVITLGEIPNFNNLQSTTTNTTPPSPSHSDNNSEQNSNYETSQDDESVEEDELKEDKNIKPGENMPSISTKNVFSSQSSSPDSNKRKLEQTEPTTASKKQRSSQ